MRQHLLLVEGVIAEGHAIGPRFEQEPGMLRCQPDAGRGILAIHHDEIEAPFAAQAGQPRGDGGPAGPPHDIAQKQDPHGQAA